MALERKGVFYTITALILLLLLVATFVISTRSNEIQIKTTQARVTTMNNLVKNIERDLERGLHIANIRSLISIEKKMTAEGIFLNDSESAFESSIINGTINNESLSLMENSTFTAWISKIQDESAKIGVDVNITIHSITVFQDSPWSIKTGANLSLHLKDLKQTSEWTRHNYVESEVLLEGYEDPTYALNTLGRTYNKIIISPYDGAWTNASRNLHLNNSYYVNNTAAPSFLMRLEGNYGSSPYGIESMINLDELDEQGITLLNKTVIDYLYFGNTSTIDVTKANMPSWFLIDTGHEARYGW